MLTTDRAFKTIVAPEPYTLTAAERKAALNLRFEGRPLLNLDQPRLVALLLETNRLLTDMTAKMKAHMAECTHRRIQIPTPSVTIES